MFIAVKDFEAFYYILLFCISSDSSFGTFLHIELIIKNPKQMNWLLILEKIELCCSCCSSKS